MFKELFFRIGVMVISLLVLARQALRTTGADTHRESDGQAVQLPLTATVTAKQLAVVNGFLGVTMQAGDSGDTVAIDLGQDERQFTLPAALNGTTGDIVYVDITDLTGHTPDDSAYSLNTPGANKVALCKLTSDQSGTFATGIRLGQIIPGTTA